MKYDDIKNRLLTYLTDESQKRRVEAVFVKIEALNPSVESVRDFIDEKVNSVNEVLDLIDSGVVPVRGVPGRLNKVISNLEKLPASTRSREREIVQEVERIKLVASSVFLDYINSAKSNFSINTSAEANRHTRGVQTALATELLLKDLYTIINIDKVILDNFNKLKGKNESMLKNLLPSIIDDTWYNLMRTFSDAEIDVIESEIEIVKNQEDAKLKLNGHNTFAILKALPERVQNLIKYQILVRRVKDIDANIELPSFDEFLSVHDYVMLLKDFDTATYEDLFNALKKNMILYSSDFDQKRYDLDKISEDNYKFNLAYFTATYIVLLHEYEELDKYTCITASELDEEKYKKDEFLIVPKEYECIYSLYSKSLDNLIKSDVSKKDLLERIINKDYFEWIISLNKYNFYTLISKFNENEIDWLYEENKTNQNNFEDTLYYLIYLKSYLKGLDLDLTDKNLERVSKFINLVNTTNDFSKLEFQYNNWLGTIRIEDFTPEELDILEKFDPNYINGISNYSLKSYHYLCKKVNANFSSDVGNIGSDEIREKAAVFQFLSDLGIQELPSYLIGIDYRAALVLIKYLDENGIDFEDIPDYYFSNSFNRNHELLTVVTSLVEWGLSPVLLPREFIPNDEREMYSLIALLKVIKDEGFDYERIMKNEFLNRFGVKNLYSFLIFYKNNVARLGIHIDLYNLPVDIFDTSYRMELSMLAVHYGIKVTELPEFYNQFPIGKVMILMDVFHKCGYPVNKIPYIYLHFYSNGLEQRLLTLHKNNVDITSLNIKDLLVENGLENNVSSYLTYLGFISPTLVNDNYSEVSSILASKYLSRPYMSDYIIQITISDFILRGKNPRDITDKDLSFMIDLLRKYSFVNENKICDITKFANREINVRNMVNKYLINEKINSNKPIKPGFIESMLYMIKGIYHFLGVSDFDIELFIAENKGVLTQEEISSLFYILKSYVDVGVDSRNIPDYLLGLNNRGDYKHLETIISMFREKGYVYHRIPYHYLYDATGIGNNFDYNQKVISVLELFDEYGYDYSEIPFAIMNSTFEQITSLVKFAKKHNVHPCSLSNAYYGKFIGLEMDEVVEYFNSLGVLRNEIPERFIKHASMWLVDTLKMFANHGVSWINVKEKFLLVDRENIKEMFENGIDPLTASDKELKYGYFASKYLDFANKIQIEEGMVYLSQNDIVHSFSRFAQHNRRYSMDQLLNAKELLYKSFADLHTIIELADFSHENLDLRVFYMPYQFIIEYMPFVIEYFKQYNGEMNYFEADRVAGLLKQKVDFIPKDRMDLDPNSPTYTPRLVVQEVLSPVSYRGNRRRR